MMAKMRCNFFWLYYKLLGKSRLTVLEKFFLSMKTGSYISGRAVVHRGGQLVLGKKTVVHQDAHLNADSEGGCLEIGDNVEIKPFAVVSPQHNGFIRIGNNSSVQYGVKLYGGGGLSIGEDVRIAANTVIVALNHKFDIPNVPIWKQGYTAKGIAIGDNVWIGANVTILDGVTIGAGSIIGAGSVVTKNIENMTVAAGVPAREIVKRKK